MENTETGQLRRWRPVVVAVSVNTVVPLGLFYGLRGAGVDAVPALLVSAVLPVLSTVRTAVTERRIDLPGVLVLTMMAASVAMSAVTGDARVLLARESWTTAFLGACLLGSLLTARPMILALGARVMPADAAQALLDRWAHEPPFRRSVVRVSALWGGAFLLDAAARVWMAYALPVDSVPGASSALMIALLVVVVLVSRQMVRAMVGSDAARSDV